VKAATATVVLVAVGFTAASLAPGTHADPPINRQATVYVTQTVHADRRYQGRTARQWASHAVANRRALNHAAMRLRAKRRELAALRASIRRRYAPTVTYAIRLASAVYGVDQSRRVSCESHGDPYAHNSSGATGLLQFLGSTWRSTPFAGFSIYDPVAQTLAGGWMIRAGRSGEWTCGL
jgi:soluble lytic murein transglycosylase-like protein